jgi:propionyl-CoA carboxylase alpha chain
LCGPCVEIAPSNRAELPARLPGALTSARRVAAAAFGDDTLLLERYVPGPRHIEVQILADTHGTVIHLGERECSLQRRHQKVIEEAPAPGIPDATREEIHEAARAAATSVGYVGAGTVEFLYDAETDKFYFLEMNTRLQVEHPVTEAIYGVYLVELHIAVAEGRPVVSRLADARTSTTGGLADARTSTTPTGHAIEVRLYAEDPPADYAPQTGTLLDFSVDHDAEFELPRYGVRIDTGFGPGDEVSTHYDAMLAKVIAWAPTRDQAARVLARRLETASLHGLVTNRDKLVASLRHPDFLAGNLSTSFYEDHPELLERPAADDLLPFVGAIALAEHRRRHAKLQSRIPAGFRTVVSAPQVTTFEWNGEEVEARWYGGTRGFRPAADAEGRSVTVVTASPERVVLEIDGIDRPYRVRIVTDAGGDAVLVDGPTGGATLRIVPRFVDPADQVAEGSLLAPMPGSVTEVKVAVGDTVTEGQPILVMEAMKMQHTIAAPYDGVVSEIPASAGDQVEAGAVLAVVDEGDSNE